MSQAYEVGYFNDKFENRYQEPIKTSKTGWFLLTPKTVFTQVLDYKTDIVDNLLSTRFPDDLSTMGPNGDGTGQLFNFQYATVGSMLIDHFGSFLVNGSIAGGSSTPEIALTDLLNPEVYYEDNFNKLLRAKTKTNQTFKNNNISVGQKIYYHDYFTDDGNGKNGISPATIDATNEYKSIVLPKTSLEIIDYEHFYNDLNYSGKKITETVKFNGSEIERRKIKTSISDQNLSDIIIKPGIGYWVLITSTNDLFFNKTSGIDTNSQLFTATSDIEGNFENVSFINNFTYSYDINEMKYKIS